MKIGAFIFLVMWLPILALSKVSVPQPFHDPDSTEITVSDLTWNDGNKLPETIRKSKAYKVWLKNVSNEPPQWYALIDIDGNQKTSEVLIASSLGGSGGGNFLLIQQTKTGEWNELATIFGAPVFIKIKPNEYSELQTYHRNGLEMWLQSYKYSAGNYKKFTETLMPRAIVTECFYQRWLQLNIFESKFGEKCS